MVNLSLHPIRLHRKETTFNDVGTTTANGRLKTHMDATLCAVSLFRYYMMVYFLWLSRNMCALFDVFLFSGRSWLAMDISDTSSTLSSSEPNEYHEHNIWNPVAYSWKHCLMNKI